MKALEEKILQEGVVVDGDILKVDGFVNHQIDVPLMEEIGKDMAEHLRDRELRRYLPSSPRESLPPCLRQRSWACRW